MPPGFARTYVYLPDGLTYSAWTEGQRDGRSFITNGPMLSFEVNGELGMGAKVSLESPGKVSVKAKAESQFPMDRVELVRNGEVIQTLDLFGDNLTAEFEGEIEIPESGWLALRAHGPAHPEVIKEPNAHTNPVWISVAGKPNPMATGPLLFDQPLSCLVVGGDAARFAQSSCPITVMWLVCTSTALAVPPDWVS